MNLHDLFDEVKPYLNLIGGTLSGDDTVIDKPHSNPKLTELISYVWSGRHHPCGQRYSANYLVLHRCSRQVITCELSNL